MPFRDRLIACPDCFGTGEAKPGALITAEQQFIANIEEGLRDIAAGRVTPMEEVDPTLGQPGPSPEVKPLLPCPVPWCVNAEGTTEPGTDPPYADDDVFRQGVRMWRVYCPECNCNGPTASTEAEARELWNRRPETAMPWISVRDRLPRDGEIVLVAGGTAQYRHGFFWTGMEAPHYARPIKWSVSHWIPLALLNPELPTAAVPDTAQPELDRATKERDEDSRRYTDTLAMWEQTADKHLAELTRLKERNREIAGRIRNIAERDDRYCTQLDRIADDLEAGK